MLISIFTKYMFGYSTCFNNKKKYFIYAPILREKTNVFLPQCQLIYAKIFFLFYNKELK